MGLTTRALGQGVHTVQSLFWEDNQFFLGKPVAATDKMNISGTDKSPT